MNVEELINQAQIRTEEIYSEPEWVGFINAALDNLTPVARMLKRIVIPDQNPVDGAIQIELADYSELVDAQEILYAYYKSTDPLLETETKLKLLAVTDSYSKGWRLTSTHLIVQGIEDSEEGDILVDVYKKLSHVSDKTDVPELPEQYHQLIVMYMCSLSQQKEEELEDKRDFYGEYLAGKQEMALDRIWQTEPHNRKLIREARVFSQIGWRPEPSR